MPSTNETRGLNCARPRLRASSVSCAPILLKVAPLVSPQCSQMKCCQLRCRIQAPLHLSTLLCAITGRCSASVHNTTPAVGAVLGLFAPSSGEWFRKTRSTVEFNNAKARSHRRNRAQERRLRPARARIARATFLVTRQWWRRQRVPRRRSHPASRAQRIKHKISWNFGGETPSSWMSAVSPKRWAMATNPLWGNVFFA